jgi:hypothetical protein
MPSDNKELSDYQKAITSPMAVFEIANRNYYNGTMTAYQHKKLHKRRLEFAQAIEALIADQCRLARIDEVEKWHDYWHDGKDSRNTDTYKADRLNTLENKND